MVHQFRTDMVRNIDRVAKRSGAGDGAARRRLRHPGPEAGDLPRVAKPRQFQMGFKLFYDEDINRFTPA